LLLDIDNTDHWLSGQDVVIHAQLCHLVKMINMKMVTFLQRIELPQEAPLEELQELVPLNGPHQQR
jgi:hypothetical protein